MTAGVLIGMDEQVAAWAFKAYNRAPMHVDKAIGVVENNQLIGAALFTSYNTVNVEFSYYGKRTLTAGIIRCLAKIALFELRIVRCTIIVPKRPSFLLRKLPKFGFRFEGVQRRNYGAEDTAKNTGCRFVIFREDIEKLARVSRKKAA